MTVLLRQTHVEGVVGGRLEWHPPGQSQLPVRVFIGEPEHADAAADSARLECKVVETNIGDRNLALDQWRVDPQRARSRVSQPRIEAAKAAGRQRFPNQRRRAGLR
jgi:hypothetical protein